MANEYFQPGSVPAPNSPGSSAVMRQEFASISAGFDKLPILAGHAGEIVTVNSTGTALVTNGAPIGDYVTKDGVFTLTNKTMSWGDNTWVGFGDAATRNAGLGAGQVLLLQNNMQLPAIDGSLLTGVTTSQISGVTDIAHGGTGATTVGGAQAALGINLKADANNAVLTGAPTAPTPPTGDNSARVATTYFVTETLANIGSFAPSNAAPLMDGVVSAGVGALGSRDDHVHPTDTTRAPVDSPTFTGNPTAPTPAVNDNDTSIATTAFVNAEINADRPYPNAVPLMDGVAAMGAAANVARQDHVHPTDTTRAPINSPTFTGDPRAPTPLTSDNDTSIATTAFVQSLIAQQPPGVQVSNSNPLMNGVVAPGTGVEASRYDHVHPSDTSRVAKSGDTMTGNLLIDTEGVPLVGMKVSGVTKGYFYANAGEIGLLNNLTNIVFSNPIGTSDLAVAGNLTAANLSGTNTGNQTAAQVSFTPAGNIAASNVQAALQELDSETQAGLATKVSKSGDAMTGNLDMTADWLSSPNIDFTTNFGHTGFVRAEHVSGVETKMVIGTIQGPKFWQFKNNGSAYAEAWVNTSDESTKSDIQPIADALAKTLTLRGCTFLRNGRDARSAGLIAQDVQAVLPEAVELVDVEGGVLGLDSIGVVGLLVEAVKELKAEFDAYKAAHP